MSGQSRVLSDLAKRIAYDIYLYHRVDCEIIEDEEALLRVASGSLSDGSLVVLGRPEENRFARWMIAEQRIPCVFFDVKIIAADRANQ